jgi:hypothetical protein
LEAVSNIFNTLLIRLSGFFRLSGLSGHDRIDKKDSCFSRVATSSIFGGHPCRTSMGTRLKVAFRRTMLLAMFAMKPYVLSECKARVHELSEFRGRVPACGWGKKAHAQRAPGVEGNSVPAMSSY